MLYVSWTHEREVREEALYVAYLLAVTGHVVLDYQNPCQVKFLQPLEHKGYKTIGSKLCNEWITGSVRSICEKVIHPANGRRRQE